MTSRLETSSGVCPLCESVQKVNKDGTWRRHSGIGRALHKGLICKASGRPVGNELAR